MSQTLTTVWRPLAVVVLDFFALNVAARLLRDDGRFQALCSRPLAILAALALALAANGALVAWHRRRREPTSWALTVATVATAPLWCAFQALAPTVGWWSGTAFRSSRWSQAIIYGISLEGTVLAYLALYRWAGSKHRLAAVGCYALLLVLSVLGTIYGDRFMLARGTFIFGGGYTIVSDVIYCLCLYLLPLALYEWLRRTPPAAAAQRP